MGEEEKRIAEYFVVAGLPHENPQPLRDCNLEVSLKDSSYLDPITDITVIFPRLGETTPDHYQMVETTPFGHSANLNHGSFRANDVFLCYRRGRHVQPLVEIGVFYNGKDRPLPDTQILECSPNKHRANVNNTTNSETYLTYKRATENSPSNELVVMDICVILASKGEVPPHSFMKIDKTLNKGIMSSDVYICYKKSVNRCDLISYKPRVLAQYPLKTIGLENASGEDKGEPAFKVDDNVALFCLPMGANLECWPADRALPSVMTSKFVLSPTNSDKIYGSAITYYEKYSNEEALSKEQREGLFLRNYRNPNDRRIFTNKCICILSHWPFFEAFEKFLFFLYQNHITGKNEVPLERYIHQFLYEIPFPSPARPRILYQLSAECRIPFFQPEELPLPRSGASFVNLLVSLGPDNCLLVLLLALTEQKILLHSFRPDILTSVAEALKQIIFPFHWQCPYIPLCPIGMSDYLAAPLPFVIGLDSRFFDMYDQPSDVNAIDLDTKTITLSSSILSEKLLPKRAARTLRSSLVSLLDKCNENEANAIKLEAQNDGELDFEFTMKRREILLELEIRDAFLKFMVSILSGYRSFLLPLTKAPTVGATDVSNLFDSSAFINSRDRYYHKFYHLLMKTQMFTKFIEERSFVSDVNAYLAFFDECMDKYDRGGETNFLELDDVESVRTVYILPPDASDLHPGNTYSYDKIEDLNPDLFAGPSKKVIDIPPELQNESDAGDLLSTPLAKRTKQEIRSAQKSAQTLHQKPYLWAKYLVNTSYSLWFIHFPSYVLHEKERKSSLRAGFSILRRMRTLRLHPADEICYRVMMQLCGLYQNPSLAVSILMEMKDCSHHPNAVTYGYYNKAVLECNWSSGPVTKGQANWNKLRNTLMAIRLFREARITRHQTANAITSTTPAPKPEGDNVSRASSEESGVSQASSSNLAKEEEEFREGVAPRNYDVGYASMNENGVQLEMNGPSGDEGCESQARDSVEEPLNPKSRAKKGAQRALFERSDSEDLAAGIREYYEGSYSPPPHSSSKSRSQSVESELIGIPSTPNSSSLDPVVERLSVGGSSLKSPMVGTPVTSNDPLGALLPKTNLDKKIDGGVKVSNSYSTLHSRHLEDNVLGEPFSDSKTYLADGGPLARSSTLPRSLYEEAGKSSSSISISPFSLKNFSKSSVTNRLKQGSSYLLNSLSPNTKTTQDVLTNIRSNVSSAATHIKTKYLDTATSLNDEHSDKISLGSNDSRRASEVSGATLPGLSSVDAELRISLAGTLWEKWIGYSNTTPIPPPDTPKLSALCDNFDKHYSNIPRSPVHPVALTVEISSASRCLVCDSAMYDEEIMAGWTAEDSNLNTKCAFCLKFFVPSLSITVKDFRIRPSALMYTNLNNIPFPRCSKVSSTPKSRSSRRIRSESTGRLEANANKKHLPSPEVFDNIRVPYLSPLVLRKELECILDREGDQCLNDPNIVDDHPIIYWNLVWYFDRIGVKSHIPGFCLQAKSLSRKDGQRHPSWASANVHNVLVKCLWDHPSVHYKHSSYLYMQYSSPESGASPLVRSLLLNDSQLSSRVRIQKIIDGVRSNKLDEPMRLFFEERIYAKQIKGRRRGCSMYRDILFLTCVVNGCDNVSFVAFDRFYRSALNKLKPTYQKFIFKSDEVPEEKALICRGLFKGLML